MTPRDILTIIGVACIATVLIIAAITITIYGIVIGHWTWVGPTLFVVIALSFVASLLLKETK